MEQVAAGSLTLSVGTWVSSSRLLWNPSKENIVDSLVGAFVEMPVGAPAGPLGSGPYGVVVQGVGGGQLQARPIIGSGHRELMSPACAILAPGDGTELVEYLEREGVPEDERPYIYTDCAELIDFLERIDEQVRAAPMSLSP